MSLRREVIEYNYENRSVQFIRAIVFNYPNLLLNYRIKHVMNTIAYWDRDKFTLIFKEHRLQGRVTGLSDVYFNWTRGDAPEDWKEEVLSNLDININTLATDANQHYLEFNGKRYWRPSEDWANQKHGIYRHKNWSEFYKQFPHVEGTYTFVNIKVWIKDTLLFFYLVPISWELSTELQTKLRKLKLE